MQSLQSRRAHRFLFVFLIGVLVGFSLWSLWLLARAQRLRGELDRHFGWLGDVSAIRVELERLRDPAVPAPEPPADLEELRRHVEEQARRSEDSGLRVAFQKLHLALDGIPAEGADPDALWRASVAALAAADELEGRIRGRVEHFHRGLGRHWRSLWLLVPGVLLLAGSNLFLLFAIHRRRLELESAHARALRSARHDPLTGLWNREGIVRLLAHELTRSARTETPLGVILADLDDFKEVNELLGYDQGDFILEQVGRRLQSLVRPYDTMGRFSGDSFLLVLPACDATATAQVAERLLRAVNERELEHAFGRIRVTMSLARATIERAEETDVDRVLRRLQQSVDEGKTSIPRPRTA